MLHLTPEAPLDAAAIESLLDRSFGIRRQRKLSYRYRIGREPEAELSLVARDAGRVMASIRYWRLLLGETPALLLGPLAVEPGLHGKGTGRALVRETLSIGQSTPFRLVLLVGDPGYYAQFGFKVAPRNVVMPGEDPARLQWLAIGDGALPPGGGILRRWPDGFADHSVEPGRQRRAHRRSWLGGDLGQLPYQGANAEDDGTALGRPAQRQRQIDHAAAATR